MTKDFKGDHHSSRTTSYSECTSLYSNSKEEEGFFFGLEMKHTPMRLP
jgi:hypothetical protein